MLRAHPDHDNLRLDDHPLVQVLLTAARDEGTKPPEFQRLVIAITSLMASAATEHLATRPVTITTPVGQAHGQRLEGAVTLVPVVRAGMGMVGGLREVLPAARIGHIGIVRNEETLAPEPYLVKLPPDIAEGPVLLLDPMLATGGSASHAAGILEDAGCTGVLMICLVAAPEGVQRMQHDHPDLLIHAAALDECLDKRGYIMPGLGDAGDRIYGTLQDPPPSLHGSECQDAQ